MPVTNSALHDPVFQDAFRSKVIALIAPASGLPLDTIEQLRHLPGLTIDIPPSLIRPEIMFHASSDDARFLQLKAALFDESCQSVIWTLRGGYGTARLLDRLGALSPPKDEKLFIGFSDNTALHLFLSQCWHWQTIHASGMAQLLNPEHDPQNFVRIAELVGEKVRQQSLTNLKALNHKAAQSSSVTGYMQGGNLTIVESSIGTRWQIKTAGALLFLEEVGEKGYRIDRSLNHLRQAGLLNHVEGIIFGECSGPDKKGIRVAIERFAHETPIPVYQTNQFGHGQINYPIVYHASAEIIRTPESNDHQLLMNVTHQVN